MDNKYRKRLWATVRELGLEKDIVYDIISTEFRKDSTKLLTNSEALYVIDRLKGKQSRRPDVPGMITFKQRQFIKQLEKSLGWSDNPARLRGFVRRYTGLDDLEWLSSKQAVNIIEGLKRIQSAQKEGAADERQDE
ncbi:MAG: DUF1018 domain-containing protein [Clostridia bacterium]|nr:DUF1018 domain-containing protein [Clostridia bacterium]